MEEPSRPLPPPPPPPPGGGSFYPDFAGGPGAPPPRGGGRAPLDPLSNRLLWLAGFLGLVLIAVVANSLLNGGEATDLNPVAQAAQRTAKMPGGKIAVEVKIASGVDASRSITAHGSGSYDAKSGRSRLVLQVPIPGHPETFHTVADSRRLFMRSPALSSTLPPGKAWMELEPLLGHNPEAAFGSGDATGELQMLETVGDVHSEGEETVRGHPTTRYAGTVDLNRVRGLLEEDGETELAELYAKIAGEISPDIPFEVWIDDKGLTRRISMTQTLPATESVDIPVVTTMELFDFGPQPKIPLPPRGAVFDTTPIVRAELGMLDGSHYSGLLQPSTAKPLSVAAFRRKGNAICKQMDHEAKRIATRIPAAQTESEAFTQGEHSPREALEALHDYSAATIRPLFNVAVSGLKRLARLSPPAAYATEYASQMKEGAISAERFEAAAAAFESGAIDKFRKFNREDDAHNHDGDAGLRRIGLDACISDNDQSAGHSEANPA